MQSKFSIHRYTLWPLKRCSISAIPRLEQCINCGGVVCPPFGSIPSCLGASLSKLGTTLSVIESLAPGCSNLYFQSVSFKDWEVHLLGIFESTPSGLTDASYHTQSSHLASISSCTRHLDATLPLRRTISSHLVHHQPTLTAEIHKVLNNLQLLSEVLLSIRSEIQQQFWEMLDSDVSASRRKLRQIMADVSLFFRSLTSLTLWQAAPKQQATTLVKHISWKHFSHLGVSQWLDDELINHFVEKWCYQSNVLGLNSFFPVKFLFETDDCNVAVELREALSDERRRRSVLKWAQNSQVRPRVSFSTV